jgi:hypothetical protein
VHFGGTFVRWNRFDSGTGYQEEPIMTFTGAATNNGLADLLTGQVATFAQTAGQARFMSGRQANAYFQDQWRVSRRLTLNLGLHWDPVAQQGGTYIAGEKSQRFPNVPAGLRFAGDPGFLTSAFTRTYPISCA